MRVPGFGADKRPTTVETATGAEIPVTPASPAPEVVHTTAAPDAAAAYEQGRADARRADALAAEQAREAAANRPVVAAPRRRGSPLLTLILVILALIGAAVIYLSLTRGSVQQGGAVVDNKLSTVAAPVRDAAAAARDKTGQAIENAGQALKNSGEKIKQP